MSSILRTYRRHQGMWLRQGIDLRTGERVAMRMDPMATPIWKRQGSTKPDDRSTAWMDLTRGRVRRRQIKAPAL